MKRYLYTTITVPATDMENITDVLNNKGAEGFELTNILTQQTMKMKRVLGTGQQYPEVIIDYVLIFKKEIFNA